ncbi:hypothetical protein [Velocimicrobium porci]|uniref:ABC transporter substrate-binding protein n=1 Tax=Velocimicrobium porci TaxID=2606634 RepID=A0A6L5XZH6_9FIRM|nr:hypothetical protein [Velocimicrobium porci]MSS64142.1 hypothetical protein [Velocimicrobium porci]
MTKVKLYWNHICVLHNQEKKFLDDLTKKLEIEDIELEVKYFGLGYGEHMSEYLAKDESVLPDMIVSADLEVFEDIRIFQKYKDDLYSVRQWIELEGGAALECVERGEVLLPYLSIPLVYYTNNPEFFEEKSIIDIKSLAFGGRNNSAGKSLVKAIWSYYGRKSVYRMLKGADISDMPIEAFQRTRIGKTDVSIVPSLYAMRADEKKSFMRIPKEGPLLIPSYICARRSIPESIARRIVEALCEKQWCDFYETNGNLLLYPKIAKKNEWCERKQYFVPSKEWISKTSVEEFYYVYNELVMNR